MKQNVFVYSLARKGPSNDDAGAAWGTAFQEIHGRELVSKPAILSKKSWGSYRRTTHYWT